VKNRDHLPKDEHRLEALVSLANRVFFSNNLLLLVFVLHHRVGGRSSPFSTSGLLEAKLLSDPEFYNKEAFPIAFAFAVVDRPSARLLAVGA